MLKNISTKIQVDIILYYYGPDVTPFIYILMTVYVKEKEIVYNYTLTLTTSVLKFLGNF